MDPRYSPMRLLRIPEPFDHPDFLFEPKIDGFRALAHVENHGREAVGRRDDSASGQAQDFGNLGVFDLQPGRRSEAD